MRPLRQQGFSLIEVLVAVLIVSVGILGVAGLQLVSLQNNTSALLRTQAFQAAYDIIDRARANPDGDYAIAMDDDAPAAVDCEGGACTAAQMRNYDVNTWLTTVAADLPLGDGEFVVNGNTITVTIRWQDERNPGGTLDLAVSTTFGG
ncbi:MAG: type IV pilus modification protein PilV [Pseudomonadales bacterium]|jgi:type IV pilus assembly protein PilV|nr:type IV pilus modification protein PilV [Pseudomonadales bacterium]